MSQHAVSTPIHRADHVGGDGEFFDSAAAAAGQGVTDLQAKFSEALPATGHFVGRLIYNSSYALSYGVVFPVMLVVRIIPKDNAVVHGLVDGALAARDRVAEWGGDTFEEDLHQDESHDTLAAENGAPEHHEESAPHRSRHRSSANAKANAKRGATRKATRPTRKKG